MHGVLMFINIDYPQFCSYFMRVIMKESQKKFVIFDFLQPFQNKAPCRNQSIDLHIYIIQIFTERYFRTDCSFLWKIYSVRVFFNMMFRFRYLKNCYSWDFFSFPVFHSRLLHISVNVCQWLYFQEHRFNHGKWIQPFLPRIV